MTAIFANLLRILMVGSVGYAGADLLNFFRAKRAGQAVPAVQDTIKDIFFSWRFLVFLGVLAFGCYVWLRGRFHKDDRPRFD